MDAGVVVVVEPTVRDAWSVTVPLAVLEWQAFAEAEIHVVVPANLHWKVGADDEVDAAFVRKLNSAKFGS